MTIVEKLKSLAKERQENAPFTTLQDFEVWADNVQPLLSFHKKLEADFSRTVTSATVSYRMGSKVGSNTSMNNAIGIVNKAIAAAEIENTKVKKVEMALSKKSDKSVKENFENHPVIFGCSLLILGLISGISIMKFIFPPALAQKAPNEITYNVNCTITGLPELIQSHDKRVAPLQSKLLELEVKSSDSAIISSYQDKYLDSANRVRADIELENKTLKESTSKLRAICEKVHIKQIN